MRYLEQLDAYLRDLEGFIDHHALPEVWFGAPDHVAIKCSDDWDFDDMMEELKPDPEIEALSYVELEGEGRRLAAATLLSSMAVGSFGEIKLIEIMEPRPHKVGNDIVGLDHMEFYYPDFDEVTTRLDAINSTLEKGKRITFEPQDNVGHAWISIIINDQGKELKLNNRTLGETVRYEVETGRANILK